MNIKNKGIMFTMVATIIFGITPIIGKLTYVMGNNGIQLAFLRHFFVLPLFFIVLIYKKISLKVSRKQFVDILKVGLIGNALTVILLYSSYSYISVGSATVLHFLYPIFVCILNFVVYKQSLNKRQLGCLILAILGIICFIEPSASSMLGFFLALISGVTFAYYMVGMDHSSIKEIDISLFNFYLVLMNSLVMGALAYFTNQLSVLPMIGYFYCLLVAVFTSFIGVVLLQKGIQLLGSSQAAILSTLEPITSIIVGIIFLNESLTVMKFLGCMLIFVSTVILIKSQSHETVENREGVLYEECQ
ncbi:MAG: EamA family transporter [Coprobacillus sp.]